MGLYDRDYTHAGSPPSMGQNFSNATMAMKLVIVTAAIYLADNLLLGDQLRGFFSLKSGLFSGHWRIWELLTYGFAHSPMSGRPGIMHILGNMYGLWFFGREVERKYGSREFLAIYLALVVFSGLIWAGVQLATGANASVIGASGAIAGLIVLFAMHYPKRKIMLMFFPVAMPAWILGLLIVGMDALGAAGLRNGNIAFVVHLAGAGLAALYFLSGWRILGGGGSRGSSGFRLPKFGGPKLKVHQPRDASLDAKADKILAKMSRDGADSITPAERKILDDYSRRVRQRRR